MPDTPIRSVKHLKREASVLLLMEAHERLNQAAAALRLVLQCPNHKKCHICTVALREALQFITGETNG
jgi:hypothetical protein